MKYRGGGWALVLGLAALSSCTGERPKFGEMATGELLPEDSAVADSDGSDSGDGATEGTDTSETNTPENTDPPSTGPDGKVTAPVSQPTGGITEEPRLAGLGEPCEDASSCESEYCVDDVCCDSGCTGVCAECDAIGSAGTCTTALQDDACPELQCPANTDCRTYEVTQGGNCAGMGECAAMAACAATELASGTSCQSGSGTCNGEGECIVPDKALLGDACVDDEECGSGHCATTAAGAKICCNEACDQTCKTCSADGFCDETPADDDGCVPITCSADTTCADYPAPLLEARCAAFGQCATAADYCTPTNASSTTSCGSEGQLCNGTGMCEAGCDSGEMWCTDECKDLDTDEANCGECGNECPTGTSCVSGECECDGANERMCTTACIDVSDDVDNCGSCGNKCPQPSTPGSIPACQGGFCGGCGAFDQQCCAGSSACSNGLTCSDGSCLCPANTHRCTTGSATGTCAANTDATACGTNCTDCTQANAQARCTSGSCNNICHTGVVQLCPGTGGKPNCGSWDFELEGTQNWQVDASSSINAGQPAQQGTIGANGTSRSLRIPYDSTASGSSATVMVPLCGTIDLTGKVIRGYARFEPAAGQSAPSDYGQITLSTASETRASLGQLYFDAENVWIAFEQSIDSGYIHAPEIPPVAVKLGLTLGVNGWKGNIYLDEIQVTSE